MDHVFVICPKPNPKLGSSSEPRPKGIYSVCGLGLDFNGRHIVSSMEKIVRLTNGVGRNVRIFSQPSALDAKCFDIRPEDLFARVRSSI